MLISIDRGKMSGPRKVNMNDNPMQRILQSKVLSHFVLSYFIPFRSALALALALALYPEPGQDGNLILLRIVFYFVFLDFIPLKDVPAMSCHPPLPPSVLILEVNHFPLAGSVADWITRRQPASAKTE